MPDAVNAMWRKIVMPTNVQIINLFYILGCAFGCTLVCVMAWRSGGCWAWADVVSDAGAASVGWNVLLEE